MKINIGDRVIIRKNACDISRHKGIDPISIMYVHQGLDGYIVDVVEPISAVAVLTEKGRWMWHRDAIDYFHDIQREQMLELEEYL